MTVGRIFTKIYKLGKTRVSHRVKMMTRWPGRERWPKWPIDPVTQWPSSMSGAGVLLRKFVEILDCCRWFLSGMLNGFEMCFLGQNVNLMLRWWTVKAAWCYMNFTGLLNTKLRSRFSWYREHLVEPCSPSEVFTSLPCDPPPLHPCVCV